MAGCEDMDSLLVTLLQYMDDLVKRKVEMETTMSEGFILLAKARMLLGKERVSMMQIPTNGEELMTARYSVHRESSDEETVHLEQKIKTSLKLDSRASENDFKESDGDMQLRHRKSDKKDDVTGETKYEAPSDFEEQTRLGLSKKTGTEPLKWFGVLVPQELKLAQKAFEKSVLLSVDCANIQIRINGIKDALKVFKSVEKGV